MMIDHPMLPFDLERAIVSGWACGVRGGLGWSFNDLDFQSFVNDSYSIVRKFGLPKRRQDGPLQEVCDRLHAELCRLRELPPNLVNGVPEWN